MKQRYLLCNYDLNNLSFDLCLLSIRTTETEFLKSEKLLGMTKWYENAGLCKTTLTTTTTLFTCYCKGLCSPHCSPQTNDFIPYVDVSSLHYVVVRELFSLQMKSTVK